MLARTLVTAGLLTLGAALLAQEQEQEQHVHAPDPSTTGTPKLEAQARTRPPPGGAHDAVGVHARTVSARVAALQRIVEQGGDPTGLQARLEELALDPVPRVALWAHAALLRIAPTLALRDRVARAALDHPDGLEAERLLRSSFPETAGALRAAAEVQRARAGASEVPGLARAVSAWLHTARAEGAPLAPALQDASGPDLVAWLAIVRALRPVPREALRALAERLPHATAADAAAIAKFFAAGPDLSHADDVVEGALLARVVSSPSGQAGPWLLALARLPRLSAEALQRADALATRGPEDAQDVAAFRHLRGAGS